MKRIIIDSNYYYMYHIHLKWIFFNLINNNFCPLFIIIYHYFNEVENALVCLLFLLNYSSVILYPEEMALSHMSILTGSKVFFSCLCGKARVEGAFLIENNWNEKGKSSVWRKRLTWAILLLVWTSILQLNKLLECMKEQ